MVFLSHAWESPHWSHTQGIRTFAASSQEGLFILQSPKALNKGSQGTQYLSSCYGHWDRNSAVTSNPT